MCSLHSGLEEDSQRRSEGKVSERTARSIDRLVIRQLSVKAYLWVVMIAVVPITP